MPIKISREPMATFKKHPQDRVKFEVHSRGWTGFEIVRRGGAAVIVGYEKTYEDAVARARALAKAEP